MATVQSSTRRRVRLLIDREWAPVAHQVARSRALLGQVARGDQPETLRLYRAQPAIAFGPADRYRLGYRVAVNAARDAGVDAVVRLSGGRPVAFHEGTIGISWTLPDPDGRRHIGERFEMASSLCCEALRALGVDARIGAVSGEYCPGRYSVSAAGVTKLAGLGQRIVRGGVHLGGVVVVSDEQRARSMLAAVYEPLGIGWDPATVGSIAGALGAPIALEAVEEAIGAALEARFGLAVPTG